MLQRAWVSGSNETNEQNSKICVWYDTLIHSLELGSRANRLVYEQYTSRLWTGMYQVEKMSDILNVTTNVKSQSEYIHTRVSIFTLILGD